MNPKLLTSYSTNWIYET